MARKTSRDNFTYEGFHFGEIMANPANLDEHDPKRALQISRVFPVGDNQLIYIF